MFMSLITSDLFVNIYLSKISGIFSHSSDPKGSYAPIKILYDNNGYVSPLQRWNHILIDFDKITYISDAIILPSGSYHSSRESYVIQINIGLVGDAPYIFNLKCYEHLNGKIDKEQYRKRIIGKPTLGASPTELCYERYYKVEEDCELVQKFMVDDLANVFRLYKEKAKSNSNT